MQGPAIAIVGAAISRVPRHCAASPLTNRSCTSPAR